MCEKSQKPVLRFAKYVDDWDDNNLSELVEKYEDPVETPHDGYIRLGIRSHAKGTFHEYVAPGHELETAQMHRVAADNLIFNITFAWEHAVAVTKESDAGKLVSHRFPQFELHKQLSPEFLKYIILDEKFHHNLYLASPGGAGRNRVLKIPEALDYLVIIPSIDEQHSIAVFLDKLTNMIALEQQKYDKLVTFKKSCLEKMFPKEGSNVPEVRFAGFTAPWEQRKLGNSVFFNPKEELPQIFEYVDLESVVGTEMLSHRTETKLSAPSRAQRLAHTGDIFYQTVRPYQKNNYLFEKSDKNYVFSTGYAQMRPFIDGYFLFSLVQSERFVKVVLDNCTGTSYPAINVNDLAEIEIDIPSDKNEAYKIGALFRNLDNLITLHYRKLDKLKSLKKAFLEKMFV